METKRTKQVIDFFNELNKALADGKVSFSEGVGLLPEGVGLVDAIKNYKELHAEMLALYDVSPDQLIKIYGIESTKFEAVFDLCNSVLNCVEEFNPRN